MLLFWCSSPTSFCTWPFVSVESLWEKILPVKDKHNSLLPPPSVTDAQTSRNSSPKKTFFHYLNLCTYKLIFYFFCRELNFFKTAFYIQKNQAQKHGPGSAVFVFVLLHSLTKKKYCVPWRNCVLSQNICLRNYLGFFPINFVFTHKSTKI